MDVLFVGAHPDDIELGAGCFVKALTSRGHKVGFLILTDDDIADVRREEARQAAHHLGVPEASVTFAGFRDGHLKDTRPFVMKVRDLMQVRPAPDVVVTHTSADSHHDHRTANSIVRAAFRQTLLLFFSIHISAETTSFSPRFFVEVLEPGLTAKTQALAEHSSQEVRIVKSSLADYERELAKGPGLKRVEGFEVEVQVGTDPEITNLVFDFNSSQFHSLWVPLIHNDSLFLLYEDFDEDYPKSSHESSGRDKLRESFQSNWFPSSPLHERYSNSPDGPAVLEREHVLLAGGAVSNVLVRSEFNRWVGIDWIVDFELPFGAPVFVGQRTNGRRYFGQFADDRLSADLAILTIWQNPRELTKSVVSCAGLHGEGTRGLLQFMAAPETAPWLLRELRRGGPAIQVPVLVDAESFELTPFEEGIRLSE